MPQWLNGTCSPFLTQTLRLMRLLACPLQLSHRTIRHITIGNHDDDIKMIYACEVEEALEMVEWFMPLHRTMLGVLILLWLFLPSFAWLLCHVNWRLLASTFWIAIKLCSASSARLLESAMVTKPSKLLSRSSNQSQLYSKLSMLTIRLRCQPLSLWMLSLMQISRPCHALISPSDDKEGDLGSCPYYALDQVETSGRLSGKASPPAEQPIMPARRSARLAAKGRV